jgi:HAD superfamily hydrolase (TIGR01549 family)
VNHESIVPKWAPTIRSRSVGRRVMLFDQGEGWELSEIAGVIWRLCDGRHSIDDIVSRILRHYEAPESVVRADVEEFLADMVQGGLIEWSATPRDARRRSEATPWSLRAVPSNLVAVTFDMHQTLLRDPDPDRLTAHRAQAVQAWLEVRGGRPPAGFVHRALASLEEDSERSWREGRHFGAREAAPHLLRRLGIPCDASTAGQLADLLEEPYAEWRLEAAPDALQTLEALRRAGMRLGIVSNLGYVPARLVRRELERAGLMRLLEPAAVVFSEDVGVYKPRPAIFQAALDALGADPEQAAHVGDSGQNDVAGAAALGMFTVRYRGTQDDDRGPEADLVISEFGQLRTALVSA